MVDLLGSVCVYGGVYVMSITVGTQMQHQPAAVLLSPPFGHDCSLDSICRQLSIASDNVQTYSTRVWLMLATIRISPAGPPY